MEAKLNGVKLPPSASFKRITYKPLIELKYSYRSKSRSSTLEAQVSGTSSELATASAKKDEGERWKRRCYDVGGHHLYTGKGRYSNTINDTCKMKLKLGHIHDEISLIELKMQTDSRKYGNALLKHRGFAKSFRQFLDMQYKHVSQSLAQLEIRERESDRFKEGLLKVRRRIAKKSSAICQLHDKWSTYRVSKQFIAHISTALRLRQKQPNPESADSEGGSERQLGSGMDTFGGDEDRRQKQLVRLVVPLPSLSPRYFERTSAEEYDHDNVTPTLCELTSNFEKLALLPPTPFDVLDYAHVTAESIGAFLAELKGQNFKVLNFKLQLHRWSNVMRMGQASLEVDFCHKLNALTEGGREIPPLVERNLATLRSMQQQFDEAGDAASAAGEQPSQVAVHDEFARKLYRRCFEPIYVEKLSCLQMVKYLEDYCESLMCELYSFERHILKRVLKTQ